MFKKIAAFVAVLALAATSAMACPKPPVQAPAVIVLSAGSSVQAGGSTSFFGTRVTSGAYDASLATASKNGNTVTTFTSTGGAAFTSNPWTAGASYNGGASAYISK